MLNATCQSPIAYHQNLACNSAQAPSFFIVARRDRTGTAVYEAIRRLAIFSATIY